MRGVLFIPFFIHLGLSITSLMEQIIIFLLVFVLLLNNMRCKYAIQPLGCKRIYFINLIYLHVSICLAYSEEVLKFSQLLFHNNRAAGPDS